MGFKTRGISQPSRFKRRASTSGRPGNGGLIKDSLESDIKRIASAGPSRPSPTAAPFNSTSFLIRRKRRYQEEEAPGAFKQYGSNMGCYSIGHDQGCCCQCQVQHPFIGNFSNRVSRDDVSQLQWKLQGLQVTDCPDYSGHHPSGYAGSMMEMDNSNAAHDQGDQAFQPRFQHRRVRSFTDDNFDLFDPAIGNAC